MTHADRQEVVDTTGHGPEPDTGPDHPAAPRAGDGDPDARGVLVAAAEEIRRLLGAARCTITLTGTAGETGADVSSPPGAGTLPAGSARIEAPLLTGDGATLGTVEVRAAGDAHAFTPADRTLLAQVARLVAARLEATRADGMRRRAERRLRFIAAAGDTLARSFDLARTVEEIVRLAVPALGEACALDLIDETGAPVRAAAHAGTGPAAVRAPAASGGDLPARRALATGRPVRVVRGAPGAVTAGSSVLLLPVVGRAPLGVLTLVAAEGRPHDDGDVATAEVFARRAAAAIENARLFERVAYQRTLLEAQGQASVDGLLVVGPEGDIRSHNRRFLEIWGLDDEVVATGDAEALRRAADLLDDPGAFRARVEWLYRHRAEGRDELRFADGRTIERHGSPVLGEDGAYHGYLWSFRDITERRLGEEARELTRTITENATSALFLMDGRGHPTYMNAAAEEMFGFTLDEVRGRPLHDTVHHHRPDGSPFPIEECPIDRALPENRWVEPYEDMFIRGDGTFFPVRAAASPIVRDGVPVGTVIEVQDITAERRDRQEVEKFVSLVEGSTEFVGMADLDRRTTYLNPAGCALVGIDPETARGLPVADYCTPETRVLFETEAIPRAIREGVYRGEWTLRHFGTGEAIPVEGTIFLVRDPSGDAPLVLATVQHDIRGRRERDRQRAALLAAERRERERQELLAEVTHALDRELGVAERLERLAAVLVPRVADLCLVDLAGDAGGIDRPVLRHADPDGDRLLREVRAPDSSHPVADVLRTGRPLLVPRVPDEMLVRASHDEGDLARRRALEPVSSVMVPLPSRNSTLGVLTATTTARSGRVLGPDDLDLLTEIGRRAGLALDNARLFEDTERARRQAEEARRRVTELHDLTARLSRAVSRAQVARAATRAMAAAVGATAAWLAGGGGPDELLTIHTEGVPAAARDRWDRTPRSAATPVAEAARRSAPVFLADRDQVAAAGAEFAAAMPGAAAAAILPTRPRGDHLPDVVALFFTTPRTFPEDERRHMLSMAELVGQALGRAERYERERALSHILQASLLPSELPAVEGLSVAAHYAPGAEDTEAGGDWYDALVLSGGRLAVTVGDVVGRGPHAAAVMGQLRSALNAYLSAGDPPETAVGRLNTYARRVRGAQATSALCVVLDPAAGTLVWACAGHPAPIVTGPGGAASLPTERGPVLGVIDDAAYPVNRRVVHPGEMLLAFSDGLYERRHEDLEASRERLERIAGAAAGGTAAEAIARIRRLALGDAAGDDDVVLVAVAVQPPAARVVIPAEPREIRNVRRALRDWTAPLALGAEQEGDLELAVSEACANAVEHAYGGVTGTVEVDMGTAPDGTVVVRVRDRGAWRDADEEHRGRADRGRGLPIMRATMDDVTVRPGAEGTEVELRLVPRADDPDDRPAGRSSGAPMPGEVRNGDTDPAGHRVVRATGDIDRAEADELRVQLTRGDERVPVVLDLRDTRHFGSAAVAALVAGARSLEAAGTPLTVTLRAGGIPDRVLAITGLAGTLRLDRVA